MAFGIDTGLLRIQKSIKKLILQIYGLISKTDTSKITDSINLI